MLDEAGVARAGIESLAESFCDGVVAPAFWLLLLGGVSYTGGIVFYAWHKKGRVHYMHGVWHLFVLLGSVLHYLCILLYVLPRAYA